MKTLVTLIVITLFVSSSFGQQALALKILKGADAPNTESQQYYLFEVANNYGYNEEIVFEIQDVSCEGISPNDQVPLSKTLFNREKTTQIQSIYVQSNKKGTFYLRISRTTASNNVTNKWNCMSIKATAKNGTVYSNTVVIKSQIPNQTNNN